jgi:alkylation response protein AidB-like acyl-CoA dehydrogenase
VRFAFTEEQRLFASIVRDVLEETCPPKAVRDAARDETGFSSDRWRRLAEVGLLGITVPEEHGGSASDEIDLVLALEETGYACLPEPVVESYLACSVLLDAPLGNDWLTAIASGESVATVGRAELVASADVAHLVLVGTDAGVLGREGPVQAAPRPSLDPTRRLFAVDPEGSPVEASWPHVLDRAAFAVAAQLVGVGRRVLELAADHARDRHQFGVPIGSFQAVKHLLANAHLGVEFARPVVYRAAWSLATGDPDRSRDASMAKAMASDAAVAACRAALQVHGAIGYTEEHDLHLWLKRGLALAAAWGTAAEHRARVRATLLG